jgi:hypothetical protein
VVALILQRREIWPTLTAPFRTVEDEPTAIEEFDELPLTSDRR